MICNKCKKPADVAKTIVSNRKIYEGCENCINTLVQASDGAPKYFRETQKKDFRRELTQPNQREYFKAYPDKAREQYGDDMMRKYG